MPMDPADQSALRDAMRLHGEGRIAEAYDRYWAFYSKHPHDPNVLHLMGLCSYQLGDYAAARASIESAIAYAPDAAPFHFNLGNVLRAADDRRGAEVAYREALRIQPGFVEAIDNLAALLLSLERPEESLALCQRSLALRPGDGVAMATMGTALVQLQRFPEAEQVLRQALPLAPRPAMAHAALAFALQRMKRLDEASEQARLAIRAAQFVPGKVDRDLAWVFSNAAVVLQSQGWIDETVSALRVAVELDPSNAGIHSNLLYATWFHPAMTPEAVFEEHLKWSARHGRPKQAAASVPLPNSRDPARRLRIGYVHPGFLIDPVTGGFVEPFLTHHDREQFELYCYNDSPGTHPVTDRFRALVSNWRDTAKVNDERFAELVRSDGIDVLVDMAGHLGGNRLTAFARRMAPVQMTYLGQPTTSAAAEMDYVVTDPHVHPEGVSDHLHTERLIRLPRCYFAYRFAKDLPHVTELPATGNGYVTFASAHAHAKLNERVIRLWASVLARLPPARIIIRLIGGEEANRSVRGAYERWGLPGRRFRIIPQAPAGEHLKLYQQVDLSLDAFPYGGCTVGLESLVMGVPFIAFPGPSIVSRPPVSILRNAGLDELVARDEEDCARKIVDLATDLPRLARLRSTLRHRLLSCPLTDEIGLTRSLEAVYRSAWQTWCESR